MLLIPCTHCPCLQIASRRVQLREREQSLASASAELERLQRALGEATERGSELDAELQRARAQELQGQKLAQSQSLEVTTSPSPLPISSRSSCQPPALLLIVHVCVRSCVE